MDSDYIELKEYIYTYNGPDFEDFVLNKITSKSWEELKKEINGNPVLLKEVIFEYKVKNPWN